MLNFLVRVHAQVLLEVNRCWEVRLITDDCTQAAHILASIRLELHVGCPWITGSRKGYLSLLLHLNVGSLDLG